MRTEPPRPARDGAERGGWWVTVESRDPGSRIVPDRLPDIATGMRTGYRSDGAGETPLWILHSLLLDAPNARSAPEHPPPMGRARDTAHTKSVGFRKVCV
jgi:hypothetical protein